MLFLMLSAFSCRSDHDAFSKFTYQTMCDVLEKSASVFNRLHNRATINVLQYEKPPFI